MKLKIGAVRFLDPRVDEKHVINLERPYESDKIIKQMSQK